jgi:hypothetical protein
MKIVRNVIFILLVCGSYNTYAQTSAKNDTIYYLLDTAHTAPNDRMISVEGGNPYLFYTINCPCLSDHYMISFVSSGTKKSELDKAAFKKIKFTHIAHLIDMAIRNDNNNFNNMYTVFFVEPTGDRYIIRKVFYDHKAPPSDDRVSIPITTSKPKKP